MWPRPGRRASSAPGAGASFQKLMFALVLEGPPDSVANGHSWYACWVPTWSTPFMTRQRRHLAPPLNPLSPTAATCRELKVTGLFLE